MTEHFATGSQGKSIPALHSLAAASFHLSFALRKDHSGFLSSLACPAVSQGSARLCPLLVASSRDIGGCRDVSALLCSSLGKWSWTQRLPAKTGNKENGESCTRCNGEASREEDEN